MGTPYEILIERFLKLIKKDKKFFRYIGLSDAEILSIIQERADELLGLAIDRMIVDGCPSVDFTNRDETGFGFDLNPMEKLLIPSLMYEYYMREDIAYIKILSVNYVPNNLRVFSPDNARNSFNNLYTTICEENIKLLDTYRNTDRDTHSLKAIDFSSYDEN